MDEGLPFSLYSTLMITYCWFVRDAITEYYRVGGIDNGNEFPHTSGGWKSKVKVVTRLAASCNFSLWLAVGCFSLCPHTGILKYIHVSIISSPIYKVTGPYQIQAPP